MSMSNDRDAGTGARARGQSEANTHSVSGWATDTKLVRTYERPADAAAAVTSTIAKAVKQWPELSDTPPLYEFVDVDKLDGLYGTKATDDSGWLPSAEFQFQSCRVTVLYGSSLRVIVNRDPH